MPLILGANSLAGGYQVKNSARFNVGSSDYLIRTISSTGSSQKFTASGWIKRSQFGASSAIYCSSDSSLDYNFRSLFINADDRVQCGFFVIASGYTFQVETSALLRDPSAWYHIVTSVDTTQSTASDRVKIYINGVLQTSFSTANYPSLNATINFSNSGYKQLIASLRDGSSIFNGCYLAEIYVLDGITKTASDFGETDEDTGIWKPKAYTGSFGTNGFYLDFEDSANLGNDMSGNNNDFTVNNLTSIDQTTDTPTNNFATMNPLDNASGSTFSEGNCKLVTTNSSESFNTGTIPMFSGKWYWEVKVTSSQNREFIGITDIVALNNSFYYSSVPNAVSYYANTGGYVFGGGSSNTYGNTYTTGDIIGVALDITNNKLYFSKNGTFQNSGDPVAGTNGISISSSPTNGYWLCQVGEIFTGSSTMELNFGNPPFTIASGNADANGYGNFEYAVPSGYYSLCTKNLADFG